MRILPTGTLESPDTQYRRRYLDLMLNPNIRNGFKARSEIIRSIREFLDRLNFVEVETPILCSNVGGASATPFKTHHKELNMDMFMRISPELYLKMLIIGGLDRVYEIGKQFRNEGLDPTHNPEFTSCEFYMTYADYTDLIPLTEDLLSTVQQKVREKFGTGNTAAKVYKNAIISNPNESHSEDQIVPVDFTKRPYNKIEFLDSLQSAVGKSFPTPEDIHEEFVSYKSKDIENFLKDLCNQSNIRISETKTLAKLFDKLFGHFVERDLIEPTFVLNHPICMSPLAKQHRSKHGLTERFELFANGMELVNAYTELNDPSRQREMFSLQERDGDDCFQSGNLENEAFVRALEYGLPPTAGWGLGVDRFVMLLTGQKSIKQVILFPTSRPIRQLPADED